MTFDSLPLGQIILLTVLYFGAVHRTTRFVTRDKIALIDRPRELFVQRWGVYDDEEDKKKSINDKKTNIVMSSLAYLWECDWCTSIWLAGFLGWLTWSYPGPMFWVLAGLSASTFTGLIALAEKFLGKATDKLEQ